MQRALAIVGTRAWITSSLALALVSVLALLYSGWGVEEFGTPAAWFSTFGTLAAVTIALRQSWKQERQFEKELTRLHKQRTQDKHDRDKERWSETIVELIDLHERLLRTPSDFALWGRVRALLASLPTKYGRLLGETVGIPRAAWHDLDPDPRSSIAGEDIDVIMTRLPQIELQANLLELRGVPRPIIATVAADYANALRKSSYWKSGEAAALADLHERHFPGPVQ